MITREEYKEKVIDAIMYADDVGETVEKDVIKRLIMINLLIGFAHDLEGRLFGTETED